MTKIMPIHLIWGQYFASVDPLFTYNKWFNKNIRWKCDKIWNPANCVEVFSILLFHIDKYMIPTVFQMNISVYK